MAVNTNAMLFWNVNGFISCILASLSCYYGRNQETNVHRIIAFKYVFLTFRFIPAHIIKQNVGKISLFLFYHNIHLELLVWYTVQLSLNTLYILVLRMIETKNWLFSKNKPFVLKRMESAIYSNTHDFINSP